MTVGIEGLISEVHPTAIKNHAEEAVNQTVQDAKQAIYDKVDESRRFFADDAGVRWDNIGTIGLIAGAVAAAAGALSGVSALVRKIAR